MPREWIAMMVLVLLLAGASRAPRAHTARTGLYRIRPKIPGVRP